MSTKIAYCLHKMQRLGAVRPMREAIGGSRTNYPRRSLWVPGDSATRDGLRMETSDISDPE